MRSTKYNIFQYYIVQAWDKEIHENIIHTITALCLTDSENKDNGDIKQGNSDWNIFQLH